MSFNNEFTKANGDHLRNSPPAGIGMNLKPSVGLFKNDGEPAIYMKGNVQCPPHKASYTMAPQFNYGMLKYQQSKKHFNVRRPTNSDSKYQQSKKHFNVQRPTNSDSSSGSNEVG